MHLKALLGGVDLAVIRFKSEDYVFSVSSRIISSGNTRPGHSTPGHGTASWPYWIDYGMGNVAGVYFRRVGMVSASSSRWCTLVFRLKRWGLEANF